ncbi:MAG: T9SS type A sorting domain-containing protein [Bacteroidetes bacterium]|nr:T9SS type A sorting domain-containing protein [Bacteroidota bacterium]
MKIFPVPATDNLYISSAEKNIDMILFTDITGRVVSINKEIVSDKMIHLNTSQLLSGTYLIRIIYNDGVVETRPVVIQQQ